MTFLRFRSRTLLLTVGVIALGLVFIVIPRVRLCQAIEQANRNGAKASIIDSGNIWSFWLNPKLEIDLTTSQISASLLGVLKLPTLRDLDTLYIRNDSNTDFQFLKHLGRVRSLKIANATDALFLHIESWASLEELTVHGDRVTGDRIGDVTDLPLKRLDLSYTSVDDDALRHIVELKDLAALRLMGTKITDAGVLHLRSQSHLRRLDLSETAVTPKSFNAIRHLASLEQLLIVRCPGFHFDNTEYFKELRHLPLKTIAVSFLVVDESGVPEIQEFFQNCELKFNHPFRRPRVPDFRSVDQDTDLFDF